MSDSLAAILNAERRRVTPASTALMFTGELGARVDPKNLSARVLKPVCVGAGLREIVTDEKTGKSRPDSWVSWHSFRHSCATQLFRLGWNAAQVCRFLGHSDPAFTLRTYVHLLDEDLPRPAVLDSLAGGSRGATEATERARNNGPRPTVEIAA